MISLFLQTYMLYIKEVRWQIFTQCKKTSKEVLNILGLNLSWVIDLIVLINATDKRKKMCMHIYTKHSRQFQALQRPSEDRTHPG